MKTFRADGQPSRDDECEHGFRRFEKCAHCLEAENERLREVLRIIAENKNYTSDLLARAALGEKE